jgi:hypothetical protein
MSVSWSDENTIAVLHALGEGTIGASLFTIGGGVRDIGALEAAKTLEARTSFSSVYALDSQRNLYAYRNISWSPIASEVLAVHFAN